MTGLTQVKSHLKCILPYQTLTQHLLIFYVCECVCTVYVKKTMSDALEQEQEGRRVLRRAASLFTAEPSLQPPVILTV